MMRAFHDCHELTKDKRLLCFEGLYINDLVQQQQMSPGSRYVLSLDFSLSDNQKGSFSTAFHDQVNESIADFCG
jgi:hypothetical protein